MAFNFDKIIDLFPGPGGPTGFFGRAIASMTSPEVKADVQQTNLGKPDYTGYNYRNLDEEDVKKYGMKKGGKVSSASKRADGIATKGKTRGRII